MIAIEGRVIDNAAFNLLRSAKVRMELLRAVEDPAQWGEVVYNIYGWG
jgi:hypothetical protein